MRRSSHKKVFYKNIDDLKKIKPWSLKHVTFGHRF